MAGEPRRRERQGQVPKPWKSDPSLSTRPPFAEGNLAALRHGADSPRMVQPIADAIAQRLPEVAPWTARPAFDGARASLAWVEAQITLIRSHLDQVGLLDSDGKPRPACDRLDRLEARAGSLRSELGLTPMSLAKLLASLATVAVAGRDEDGLAALKAEGAEIVAAREFSGVADAVGVEASRE